MRSRLLFVVGVAASCGTPGNQPTPFREPPVLTDINPDPNVVEVQLVAAQAMVEYLPGKPTEVWAYRDGARADSVATVPGPLLRAKQGDEVVVHLQNDLPEATTIHWHGLRVMNEADGTPSTQRLIEPGETFVYRFKANDAGSFWYHPHVRGDVQIERGLYAPLVVTGEPVVEVTAERYLVLDDVLLESDGKLSDATKEHKEHGRLGNVWLVNGQPNSTLKVAAGSRERWRFVNAANSRFFNLRLDGAQMLVIGSDGGLIAEPYKVDTLLIVPGERYEVLVTFAGTRAVLETLAYDRGDHDSSRPQKLLTIESTSEVAAPLAPVPSRLRDVPLLAPIDGNTPVRPIVLSDGKDHGDETAFFINHEHEPKIRVKQGGIEIWEVQNEAEMDHPFHLHGMFFEVLPGKDGKAPLPGGWKDMVNVPRKSSVRFAVHYEPLGTWMFHCHILEHSENGMMGELIIE